MVKNDKKQPPVVGIIMDEMADDKTLTARTLSETAGVSITTMNKMLRALLSDEIVDFWLPTTSTSGRPPRQWFMTEKGKLMRKGDQQWVASQTT
jgi:response regulator of citrate/malate metabolism